MAERKVLSVTNPEYLDAVSDLKEWLGQEYGISGRRWNGGVYTPGYLDAAKNPDNVLLPEDEIDVTPGKRNRQGLSVVQGDSGAPYFWVAGRRSVVTREQGERFVIRTELDIVDLGNNGSGVVEVNRGLLVVTHKVRGTDAYREKSVTPGGVIHTVYPATVADVGFDQMRRIVASHHKPSFR